MRQTIKDYKFLSALCCLAFCTLICFGPYMPSDSAGYIEASYARGLLYPLFLKLFFKNFYLVVFAQLALGLTCIFYTVVCFSKVFEKHFNGILQGALFAMLLAPYIGHTNIGNTILTEPIAYPLFLCFFCNLLLWKKFERQKYFFISLFLALLLMLAKKQLGFVFAGFYGWIFLNWLHSKKIKLHLTILPIVFFAAGLLIEKSYVWAKTGIFMSTPSAIFTISAPLYIAKPGDVDSLKTPEQKHFLKEAIKERDRQKLAMYQEDHGNFSWPYHKKFEIIHDVLSYEISSKIFNDLKLDVPQKEELVSQVRLTIFKNNLLSFFKFYYHNIIGNMGGYYYFFAVICAFFLCCWRTILNDKNFIWSFGLATSGLQFLNYGTIAIFMPVLRRYSLYTDGLMICFWLLCLSLMIDHKKDD